MDVELRAYQVKALADVRDAMRDGHKRVMLQIPTGGGKTLTGASMLAGALAKGSPSIFVAHRLELVDQTVSTFARLGITSIGVIRAGDKRKDASQPIQIASIQTLARRTKPPAKIVFIDEAHRSCADSYEKHLFQAYPEAFFVGLSATPCRTDGKPLGARWQYMVHGAKYSELIALGFLVAPEVYSTPVLPDLSKVRTTGGEYNAEDLEAAVNRRALIGNTVEEWLKRSGRRRTVAFAVSVAHSRALVEAFAQAGVRAEHLDGETHEVVRRAILARLASGETELVSNVGVLCEGWDCPPVKCLVLARPTKSLVLFMQMAGRILRPWEGVTPIILDHGANVDRHGMPHEDREWSLSTKAKKGGAAPVKACPACFAMVSASTRKCPHCDHVFEDGGVSSEPPEPMTHVELALRTLDGDDAQLAFFKRLVKTATDRHWNPGAVLHRFREKYGVLPPKLWYLRFKRAYGKDRDFDLVGQPPSAGPAVQT